MDKARPEVLAVAQESMDNDAVGNPTMCLNGILDNDPQIHFLEIGATLGPRYTFLVAFKCSEFSKVYHGLAVHWIQYLIRLQ